VQASGFRLRQRQTGTEQPNRTLRLPQSSSNESAHPLTLNAIPAVTSSCPASETLVVMMVMGRIPTLSTSAPANSGSTVLGTE